MSLKKLCYIFNGKDVCNGIEFYEYLDGSEDFNLSKSIDTVTIYSTLFPWKKNILQLC